MNLLIVSRHDYTNTATGNISEANMKATEFVSDDKKHSKKWCWIFTLGQKIGGETERQCDLGWLIKIRLQNMPWSIVSSQLIDLFLNSLVKNEEALENL